METDKASHVAEESLLLAQFSSTRQTENLIAKLQNGGQLSEATSPDINGDTECNRFRFGTAINQIRRLRDTCSSPNSMQDFFDQSPHMTNGELKRTCAEVGSQEYLQPKKLKTESEINGRDTMLVENATLASWGKKEPADMENREDHLPELAKSADFMSDSLLTGQKLEKKGCSLANGDIFSLSKNKQVPTPNGATTTSSTMVDTPGELLEKTLSQYYPDQVSITPQNSASQENAIGTPLASDTSKQATHLPSFTSGLPNLSQVSASKIPLEMQSSNIHNASFALNGYSSRFGKGYQQQLEQPFHRLGNPALKKPHTVVAEEHNEKVCFQPDEQRMYLKPIHDSCSTEVEPRPTAPNEEDASLSPFASDALVGDSESSQKFQNIQMGQWQGQYAVQQLEQTKSVEISIQCDSLMSTAKNQSNSMVNNDTTNSTRGLAPQSYQLVSQKQGPESKNKIFNKEGSEVMSKEADANVKVNWIDLNSSQHPRPASPQLQMWGGFCSPFQQHQGSTALSQGQSPDSSPLTKVPMEISTQPGFQQQDKQVPGAYSPSLAQVEMQYNAAGEWQHKNTSTPPGCQAETQMQASQQHVNRLPLRSLSQEQTKHEYHIQMEQEHLHKQNQDIEDIFSSNFLQQPMLPHPYPRAELQQPVTSQYGPGQEVPQPPESCKRQFENHHFHGLKLQEHISFKEQLKPDCQPENVAEQPRVPGLSPHGRNTPRLCDPSLLSKQPPNGPVMLSYVGKDGAMIQEAAQQIKYSQKPPVHRQLHRVDFHLPTSQPQPQLSQGAMNKQSPEQRPCHLQPKMEQLESCAQDHRGPTQGYPPGDLQRHAALRTYLLQRQNMADSRPLLQAVKHEDAQKLKGPALQPIQRTEGSGTLLSVKQEATQVPCGFGPGQRASIIATMEQQLRQYQPSLHFERKSLVTKSPCKVKVETSGAVTVLSTNTNLSEKDIAAATKKPRITATPVKMEPNLNTFIDSPIKLLNTPVKNLLDIPVKTQYDVPSCHCVEQLSEKDEGPYYTHLGAAPNVASIREIMEKRFGQTGSCIRIEKVVYTGKEGKSTQGCPIAKWVIRRSGVEEKLLVLVRERAGHSCATACLVVAILIWEGIPTSLADRLYMELSETLRKHGALTNRRCALNEERTCACQGLDPDVCGASFSFGCSWSMYYNGCKFARSKTPRKFKLLGDDTKEEEKLEQNLQNLATLMAPTYKKMAPDAYGNQVEFEHRALDCRLGLKEGRPFSGVTACLDFCAHAHRDLQNMHSGSTVVCTLTREDNREIGKVPEEEQLHVLPLYVASQSDEFGSVEGQQAKVKSGAIQVLTAFRRQVRMLAEPAKSCRQKKLESRKTAANKAANQDGANAKADKALQAKVKQSTYETSGQTNPASGSHPGHYHRGGPQSGQQQQLQQQQQQQWHPQQQQQQHPQQQMPQQHPQPQQLPQQQQPRQQQLPQQQQQQQQLPQQQQQQLPLLQQQQQQFPQQQQQLPQQLPQQQQMAQQLPQQQQQQQQQQLPQQQQKNELPQQEQQQQSQHPQQQQQQKNQPHTFPGPSHTANYPRSVNHADPFQGTSPSTNTAYPQSSASTNHYSGSLHLPNAYINGPNPVNCYPGNPMNSNSLYPGCQSNSSMPMDKFHPHYGSNPKHFDMYQQQRPPFFTQQQYSAHQRFDVRFHSPPGLQVNGYSDCSTKPGNHPTAYPMSSSNGSPDPQFLEVIPRPTQGHQSLDYTTAVDIGKECTAYPYLSQNPPVFSPDQGAHHMQNKPEINLHSTTGITQIPAAQANGCPKPAQSGLEPSNVQEAYVKQEPGVQNPDRKQQEEVWSDNEHNFLDPEIGGVAVAPSHGSILIECAKREMHATTPVKNPNRNQPTRISLVFYQHKNMIEAKHGLALWEAKMAEKAREKEEEAEKYGAEGAPSKGKKTKREHTDATEHGEPLYKRFIQTLTERSMSCTTNTYVNTAPYTFSKVTGPYNCFT